MVYLILSNFQVVISPSDLAGQVGLSFKSEISFHGLTILHPDSKLGVGVVLFSNISMSPTDDFVDTYHVSVSSADGSTSSRVRHAFSTAFFGCFICDYFILNG